MVKKHRGNCYICGVENGMGAMKTHILKTHQNAGDEPCVLLLIESNFTNGPWLFVDVAPDAPLSSLDTFLRRIWLECCGHMSEFKSDRRKTVAKKTPIGTFAPGEMIFYEYDFGSTTLLRIGFIGNGTRPKQKEKMRLIARNIMPEIECSVCGKPATQILTYDDYDPFCDECAENADEDPCCMLPLTNSPRCGICGYCGEQDVYGFVPENCTEKPAKGKK